MQHTESGPLFDFRFRLRSLMYAVTVGCLMLSLRSFTVLSNTFVVFSLGLTAFAVWMATRTAPRYLGILIVLHLAIATFLLIGPIVSYHINGRAWYDYGLSAWNPPPSYYEDGRTGVFDYDPAVTRPAVWPVIGPIMYLMCWLSIGLMIVPPTALVVSISMFVLAIRLRHVLTGWQSLLVWTSWSIGLIPVLYLMYWGGKVFEWIAD